MVVIAVIYVLIVKLATLNVIQTINYYRLYINDIYKADNEVKYTKLNKKNNKCYHHYMKNNNYYN